MTMATNRQKEERTERPITVNCNDKGGIDTIGFEKYLKESISPLYTDAADIPKYIIVDSVPSRCNTHMVKWPHARNFTFYQVYPIQPTLSTLPK